jgi:hypothetical protein
MEELVVGMNNDSPVLFRVRHGRIVTKVVSSLDEDLFNEI